MQQDKIIKFCVVGEQSVVKTSILYQYIHQKFDQKVRPTIGCDFSIKIKSSVDNKYIRLQIWDIAGQQRFNSVSKTYLRGALGFVIVCSAVDAESLMLTLKWKKIIEESLDCDQRNIPCLLVQNKCDLIDTVDQQEYQTQHYLQKFAKQNNFCGYLQCSAKDNKNIAESFQFLIDEANKRGLIGKSNRSKLLISKQDNVILKKTSSFRSEWEEKRCC